MRTETISGRRKRTNWKKNNSVPSDGATLLEVGKKKHVTTDEEEGRGLINVMYEGDQCRAASYFIMERTSAGRPVNTHRAKATLSL